MNDTGDFFRYDGRLFDSNRHNDDDRNRNADGHVTLTKSRPDRILVILNQYRITH